MVVESMARPGVPRHEKICEHCSLLAWGKESHGGYHGQSDSGINHSAAITGIRFDVLWLTCHSDAAPARRKMGCTAARPRPQGVAAGASGASYRRVVPLPEPADPFAEEREADSPGMNSTSTPEPDENPDRTPGSARACVEGGVSRSRYVSGQRSRCR